MWRIFAINGSICLKTTDDLLIIKSCCSYMVMQNHIRSLMKDYGAKYRTFCSMRGNRFFLFSFLYSGEITQISCFICHLFRLLFLGENQFINREEVKTDIVCFSAWKHNEFPARGIEDLSNRWYYDNGKYLY